MGFLDNLENNLKALESRDDPADAVEGQRRRDAERKKAVAAAPWAARLRSGSYTEELLRAATRAGYARRTKVHMAWLDTVLRLEARDRRLELRPTSEGVTAVFIEQNREVRKEPVDLDGNPESLISELLG